MKANKKKMELAMARACLNITALSIKAELPQPTVKNVYTEQNARTATVGKIAKALGVDVTELLED